MSPNLFGNHSSKHLSAMSRERAARQCIGDTAFPNKISNLFVASLALFLLIAEPALAQSIDLSPIQSLLQGIVDALTGPLGVVIATLAVLGVFLSWFFNIIDLRQALWVLVGIAGVAAAPTIVAAVFAGG